MTLHDLFPRPFHFHPKNWTIGTRVIFLGVLTTVISGLAIVSALYTVLTQYTQAHKELRQQYLDRSTIAVQTTGEPRRAFAKDYAQWDEMYHAVQSKDIEWFQRSTTGSLSTFDADAYWISDRAGSVLYSERAEEISSTEFNQLSAFPSFSCGKDADYFQREQTGTLVHYNVAPIVDPTEPELQCDGFMIVAKIWDTDRLTPIGSIVGASVHLTDAAILKDADQHIRVSVPLLDSSEQAISYATFQYNDFSLQLIRNSLLLMIAITTVLGGALIYFSHRLLYHWIVDPVGRIIERLRDNISEQNMSKIFASNDELVILENIVAAHVYELGQNRRLSLAVEASTNGIVVTDLQGMIQYVNEAWTTLNGYSQSEAIGKNPRILQSGKTPPEKYVHMWDALKAGNTFTTESIVNRRKDGSEYDCRLSVYPIQEKGKTVGYVGIQQNISHRKEVDRMKTEFISMASHQLRTPLSAMRWFGELLLSDKAGTLSEKQKELVQNFYDSTLRMISLVNALLNISRLESGRMIVEPKPTQLKSLVDTVIGELSARIEAKKLTLTQKIDSALPMVSVDPQLVREVYSNLLTNAVKYTPEGGTIGIEICEDGDAIRSSIRDSGVGIPEADHGKIFSKFFRAKNVTSFETDGTGLGLYLVKTIIKSSDGDIGFESSEGKGTTFWFTLPKSGMKVQHGSVRIGA